MKTEENRIGCDAWKSGAIQCNCENKGEKLLCPDCGNMGAYKVYGKKTVEQAPLEETCCGLTWRQIEEKQGGKLSH